MEKSLLIIVGIIYSINAIVMWFAPEWWYQTVPGITMMGPFNLHFIRDIGLVYLVSGLGLVWGTRSVAVAYFACLWPALHALFHLFIFFDRGSPIDDVSITNLFLIQLPAWGTVWATVSLQKIKFSS